MGCSVSLQDDIEQAIKEHISQNKQVSCWVGTVSTVSPLQVTLDGTGVAVPCLATDFTSLVEGRRVAVFKLGSDLWALGSAGGSTLTGSLNVRSGLVWGEPGKIATSTETSAGSHTNPGLAYTALSTPANLTFYGPPSGKVKVTYGARITTGAAITDIFVSPEIRVTDVSGAIVLGTNDNDAFSCRSPTAAVASSGACRVRLLSVTSGTLYYGQLMTKCSVVNASNTIANARLLIEPVI